MATSEEIYNLFRREWKKRLGEKETDKTNAAADRSDSSEREKMKGEDEKSSTSSKSTMDTAYASVPCRCVCLLVLHGFFRGTARDLPLLRSSHEKSEI